MHQRCFQLGKLKFLNRQKRRFDVYQKACFQGKKKENTYTPKRLQGVCGGPFRGVLVYRFWSPMVLSKGKATKFVRTRAFSRLTRFRNTENLVNSLGLDMDVVETLSTLKKLKTS